MRSRRGPKRMKPLRCFAQHRHSEGIMTNVASPAPLKGARVLIVEDESLVASYLEELLGIEGCIVVGPVSRVPEALALIERERPEAAILDLNLHGEPTIAVAEALTARHVPFVVVTGYGAEHVPSA